MAEFKPFEFTDEFLDRLRVMKEIPVHFYNKDGQILLYKKEDVTTEEIDRLVRFRNQGIYYNVDDARTLALKPEPATTPESEIPEGLTDTKLLSEKHTDELIEGTVSLFGEIRNSSLNAFQTQKAGEKMEALFSDFASQEDAKKLGPLEERDELRETTPIALVSHGSSRAFPGRAGQTQHTDPPQAPVP